MGEKKEFFALLADGSRISFIPFDERAGQVVALFARYAGLASFDGESDHVFSVRSTSISGRKQNDLQGELVLDPEDTYRYRSREPGMESELPGNTIMPLEEWMWRQFIRLSACLGAAVMNKGGFLVHSGLIEFRKEGSESRGILLSGASGSGKSTTSRMLRPPWYPLSDDLTLVVRKENGSFAAHPLPTWSRILGKPEPALDISFDISRNLTLNAVLFLDRSTGEKLEPMRKGEALCRITELVKQANVHFLEGKDLSLVADFNRQYFLNLVDLVRETECFDYHLKIDERFWKEVQALPQFQT